MNIQRTLLLLAVLGSASTALAQGAASAPSKATGLMFGAGLNRTSIKFEGDDEADSGSGATLQIGYGFTSRLTVLFDISRVAVDGDPGEGEVSLTEVFVGLRAHLRGASARWIPFIDLGPGRRNLGRKNVQICDPTCAVHELTFLGEAFMFGGGVSFYTWRRLAVTGALTFGVGKFSDFQKDNVTVPGVEVDARSSRLNLGISWWPGR